MPNFKFSVMLMCYFTHPFNVGSCLSHDNISCDFACAEADPKIIANIRVRLQRATYGRGVSFQQLFEEIDLDGNGLLEMDEFEHCVRNVLSVGEEEAPDSALSSIFNYIDIEGNGSATMNELVNFLMVDQVMNLVIGKLESASYRNGGKNLGKLFRRCDTDRDGTLSSHEFIRAVRTVMRVTPSEANDLHVLTLYEVIDQPPHGNGDGEISIDEMVTFLESKMKVKPLPSPKKSSKGKNKEQEHIVQENISLQRRSPLIRLYDELCVGAVLQHRLRHDFIQNSSMSPTEPQTRMATSTRLLTFGDMEVGLMGAPPGAPPQSCHIIADENALMLALRLWLITDFKKSKPDPIPEAEQPLFPGAEQPLFPEAEQPLFPEPSVSNSNNKSDNNSSHRRLSTGLVALKKAMDSSKQTPSGAAAVGFEQFRSGLKTLELELCQCYLLSGDDQEPYRFTGNCISPAAVYSLFRILCTKKDGKVGRTFVFESFSRLLIDALLNGLCVSDEARKRALARRDPKDKLFRDQKEQQQQVPHHPLVVSVHY